MNNKMNEGENEKIEECKYASMNMVEIGKE
jgi:hypothetical protein